MVVVKVRVGDHDWASIGDFYVLKATPSINDDLEIWCGNFDTSGMAAKSGKILSGYRNRSSHAMECDFGQTFTPSLMRLVKAFRNQIATVETNILGG